MSQRERILAAVVVAALVVWGGTQVWEQYQSTVSTRRANVANAEQQVMDARLALRRGQRALERLDGWRQRSLPAGRDLAQSLYRTWLLDECREAGLEVDDIQPSGRTLSAATHSTVGYTIRARGTIAALTNMLYAFYRSVMLHQITHMQVTPTNGSSELRATLSIEALVLPGATHEDQLPAGTSDRLDKESVEAYVETIEDRNLFAAYRPPRPEPEPVVREERSEPPPFDDAKFAYVTGIVQVGDRLQAWITVRTTGEVLRLHEGDPLKVGLIDGRILSIAPRTIVFECDEGRMQVALGENLRDGTAVAETTEG